jgi:hypothetical protein
VTDDAAQYKSDQQNQPRRYRIEKEAVPDKGAQALARRQSTAAVIPAETSTGDARADAPMARPPAARKKRFQAIGPGRTRQVGSREDLFQRLGVHLDAE